MKSFLHISLLLSACIETVRAMSYLALDSRNPEKCVKSNYPENAILDIHYEVLDPKKDKLHMGVKMSDPLSGTKVAFVIEPIQGSDMARDGRNVLSQEIKTIAGKLRYQGSGEGELSICIRISESQGKKYVKPALVGFRISETGEAELEEAELKAEEARRNPTEEKNQAEAKVHLSEMERILMKMIKDSSLLLRNADMIKDEEAAFHKQSVEMNSASKWWPMLHVVVLLVTGFTQANHVIRFFKSRHII